MPIKLIINTPEGKYIDNKVVDIVNLQTTDGDIGVLGGMAPMVTDLKIGNMNYREKGNVTYIHLHRGLAIIKKNECKIITERLYPVDEKGNKT